MDRVEAESLPGSDQVLLHLVSSEPGLSDAGGNGPGADVAGRAAGAADRTGPGPGTSEIIESPPQPPGTSGPSNTASRVGPVEKLRPGADPDPHRRAGGRKGQEKVIRRWRCSSRPWGSAGCRRRVPDPRHLIWSTSRVRLSRVVVPPPAGQGDGARGLDGPGDRRGGRLASLGDRRHGGRSVHGLAGERCHSPRHGRRVARLDQRRHRDEARPSIPGDCSSRRRGGGSTSCRPRWCPDLAARAHGPGAPRFPSLR